jgi:thioesterase domain-containing protein
MCYAALARRLDADQPFYGLQARGLDGAEPPHSSIEEMAAHYIDVVRGVQPEGPYLLGGWSMGGVVAFEMARRLEEIGEGTALLALLDSRNPCLDRHLHRWHDLSRLEAFAFHLGIRPDYSAARRARLRELEPEVRLDFILNLAKTAGAAPGDMGLEEFRRRFELFNSNIQALRSYAAKARRGRIVLFRASEAKRNSAWDETLGWVELAAEGVEVHEVPGDHFSMMRPPHVEQLAGRLAACIRGDLAADQSLLDAQRLNRDPSADWNRHRAINQGDRHVLNQKGGQAWIR